MQFVNTLSTKLAKMYGSVLVQVTSISSGSVVVGTSVSFLDSVSGGSDAAAYEQLLSSSSASNIYGTYAAAVDVSTITSSRTLTPSTGKQLASQCINKQCCLSIHDVKCVSCTAVAGIYICTFTQASYGVVRSSMPIHPIHIFLQGPAQVMPQKHAMQP